MRTSVSTNATSIFTQPHGPVYRTPFGVPRRGWVVVGCASGALGLCVVGSASLPQPWASLLLAGALFPFAAMITGAQRLLLAVLVLEIPLQLDTYLFYRVEPSTLGALSGVNVSLGTLCLTLLYALWLARLLNKVVEPVPALLRKSLPLLVYVGAVALSVAAARMAALAGFEVALLVQTFFLYLYIVGTVRTRREVVFIVNVLLFGLVLQSLIMIGTRVAGAGFEVGPLTARVDSDFGLRVGGTVGSPNGAAAYLTLLLAPALAVLLGPASGSRKARRVPDETKGASRGLAALAFGLGSVALFLTFSRGGWIAFAVSVTLLYLVFWHRGWLSPKIHMGVFLLVAVLGVVFQNDIVTRLFGDDNQAAYGRLPLMVLAFEMIRDHPLLGVGANNFAAALGPYLTPTFSLEWIYTVHNKYLLVWAEAGPVALVAFLWFLLSTLRRGWRGWRRGDPLLAPLALGFTVAVLGGMIHMNVDIFNGRPQVQMLWLVAGLITALSTMGCEEKGYRGTTGEDGVFELEPPTPAAGRVGRASPSGFLEPSKSLPKFSSTASALISSEGKGKTQTERRTP